MSIEASFAPDRLAVASAGSDFVVASVESAGVFRQWIGAKGTLLSSGKLRVPSSGDIVDVAVASSGDEAVILWIEAACTSLGHGFSTCDYVLKSASVARDGTIS